MLTKGLFFPKLTINLIIKILLQIIIVNAFGKLQETITAIEEAIVLGHSDSSAAFPGMPIMAFGVHHKRGQKTLKSN